MTPNLTIETLCSEAAAFAQTEANTPELTLYGVTDGKAIGTYLEHKFQRYLHEKYTYVEGSSAKGIDFPELNVDMKATKITQPQSSCPFKSARQKIYGLGYSLLLFVYEKADNSVAQTGNLNILHTTFIESSKTADYQTSSGLLKVLGNDGNVDDIIAFLMERRLPIDDIQANQIAEEILTNPPKIGYLTISNALQWRLQYRRVIDLAGQVDGIRKLI
ncbi:MAG: restriction endonuclease [Chloroflexi bacterium]|nr:restriction endonuclease [Chloroflexota bacterium]